MPTPATIADLTQRNSTSYADVAGLMVSMDRIQGETTDAYIARLRAYAAEQHNRQYEGVLNSIAYSLGLDVRPGIAIAGPTDTVISCDLSGLSLVSGSTSLKLPLAVIGEDDVWDWQALSQLVTSINGSGTWTATLLADDGPAVQLCRQTNSGVGMPYECVVSPVGLIALTEPSLPSLAVTSSGTLAYQMREFIQSIMTVDGSYWPR